MSPREATLGILLLDTTFPRIPGDVGNPSSYPFPVRIKRVVGATVKRVVYEADPKLRGQFIDAAQELAAEGVAAITSSCGFLSPLQADLAQAVTVPVFISSLMQVPIVHAMTGRPVAILTANNERLTENVLEQAGITSGIPVVTAGLENVPAFRDPILKDGASLDRQQIENAILTFTHELLENNPDIGAFVFECHNLAPYARIVQETHKKPVFDIIDFAIWVYSSIRKRTYPTPANA